MWRFKRILALTIAVAIGTSSWAAAGGRPYPSAACPPNGNCVPQRKLYGFYPTTWRRWPTDNRGSVVAKPEPESVPRPTPVQAPPIESTPAPPEEAPQLPSETMPTLPTEIEPGIDSKQLPFPPSQELPGMPPSEPSSAPNGALPQELPKADELPAELPPEPPAKSNAPAGEPKSPSLMPETDPFADEPSADEEKPPAPPKESRNILRGGPQPAVQAGFRWHAPASAAASMPANEPEKLHDLTKSPERLVTVESEPRVWSPAAASGRSNPLRSSAMCEAPVVPAASWTAESRSDRARPSAGRSNPLRAN